MWEERLRAEDAAGDPGHEEQADGVAEDAELTRAKQRREKEVASNSDWLGRNNTFDSLLAPTAPSKTFQKILLLYD